MKGGRAPTSCRRSYAGASATRSGGFRLRTVGSHFPGAALAHQLAQKTMKNSELARKGPKMRHPRPLHCEASISRGSLAWGSCQHRDKCAHSAFDSFASHWRPDPCLLAAVSTKDQSCLRVPVCGWVLQMPGAQHSWLLPPGARALVEQPDAMLGWQQQLDPSRSKHQAVLWIQVLQLALLQMEAQPPDSLTTDSEHVLLCCCNPAEATLPLLPGL